MVQGIHARVWENGCRDMGSVRGADSPSWRDGACVDGSKTIAVCCRGALEERDRRSLLLSWQHHAARGVAESAATSRTAQRAASMSCWLS